MQDNEQPDSAIQSVLGGYLNIEDYDLDDLATWCHRADVTHPHVREFKEQLHAAVEQPGLVTPKIYQSWTANRKFRTQEQLQDHLKEIWNACFPDESRS